jgi:hypothetical protein
MSGIRNTGEKYLRIRNTALRKRILVTGPVGTCIPEKDKNLVVPACPETGTIGPDKKRIT